jgi:5-methylcytosine-specific restriction endonuclease McrA
VKVLQQRQPRLRLSLAEYEAVRKRVLERDGWRCQSCGSLRDLQVHHMKPRSQLGRDALENLITLCVSCHQHQHTGHCS